MPLRSDILARAENDYAADWSLPLPSLGPEDTDDGTETAARLLRVARWHAGLSQAELATRARTSQQTLVRYESGRTQPTLPTLLRLLAACGMGLDPALVPLVDVDAPAVTDMLQRTPLDRIPVPHRHAVEALVPLLISGAVPFAVTGKLAARLYGTPLRLYECSFALAPDRVRVSDLEGPLLAAGASFLFADPVEPRRLGDECDGTELLGEHLSRVQRAEVRFSVIDEFDAVMRRARTIELVGCQVPVFAPSDLVRTWHERDRDRLLLARAVMQRRRSDERQLT